MYNMFFWLFYDGEEVGSYIELQQRQMWCFCLRSLLWQPHSFSAWLEKLFCHEFFFLTKIRIVHLANEANGSQHRSKSDLHWWLPTAQCQCILKRKLIAKGSHHITCSACIGCKVTGKVKQSEMNVVIDQAMCLVCLARLWSALWSASDIVQACDCIVCKYIAWLTQY